jgi:hypothetical protein
MRREGEDTDKGTSPKGLAETHSVLVKLSSLLSDLRARLGAQQSPIEGLRSKRVDDLYEAIWDRIVRAMGSAVVNRETNNWLEYFDSLRTLIRKTIGESSTCGLSESEKEDLIRRLEENIRELANELHRSLDGSFEKLEL